ncbi:pitrilysin family protein [uncultured Bacteroides sp.]|uniref:M16 family metallopeptidase n=1 Tax=uncultured Bacteroides sp. TaxID=162156 RepID=UPI002AAAC07A|nr:pitrilysin family protein [uncultured Bacteroides sp.]
MLNRKTQPEIKALEDISIAAPQRKIMSNGIPLNVIEAGNQEVVRMDILIGAGKWHQTQLLQTLFTNRMLREGTKRFTSAEIAEKLDYYGAWLELSTSMEYSYITLYSLNKYLASTLEVVESIVKEPLFPQKELNTVVDTNKHQFLINSTKVEYLAQKSFAGAIFGEQHPCGRFASADDYDKVTSACLKEFYDKYYHSGNCSIYIAGKITDGILNQLENTFGKDTWGQVENKSSLLPYAISSTTRKRLFTEQATAMQSSLKMGKVMIQRSHPDYYKLRVLVTIFGGYFGSRLMSNIREDKGYTYGISSGIASYPDTGVFMVATEAANEYVEDIIKEVYHEMSMLQTDLVPDSELNMVRNYMLGDMCRSYEGPFSLSDAWMFIQTSNLSDSYFEESLNALISVTAEEIRILAQKYFDQENMVEVIAGKSL